MTEGQFEAKRASKGRERKGWEQNHYSPMGVTAYYYLRISNGTGKVTMAAILKPGWLFALWHHVVMEDEKEDCSVTDRRRKRLQVPDSR